MYSYKSYTHHIYEIFDKHKVCLSTYLFYKILMYTYHTYLSFLSKRMNILKYYIGFVVMVIYVCFSFYVLYTFRQDEVV